MTALTHPIETQELQSPKGRTIGFVDTPMECEAMTQALNKAGFADANIVTLRGDDGLHSLERMMEGSLWGESAEEVLKQGTTELRDGHSVVCVEVRDAQEAATVAEVSTQHGGRSIYHFGSLIDTRLTR